MCTLHFELPSNSLGNLMGISDQDLVREILGGSTEAFEVVFDKYQRTIEVHLIRIVRDREAANDLVQDVFLLVWNRAGQWNGQGPFKAWLFRIATNMALNYLRSRKRRREQPLEAPIEPNDEDEQTVPGWMIDNAALGPDMAMELEERRRLLQGFVDDLPQEKQKVFRMVHESELDLREVAEQLQIPEGTVKSRLYYARKRIASEWRAVAREWEEFECQ